MSRLIQALLDTTLRTSAPPNAAALVDTRSMGKVPTFTGEYKYRPQARVYGIHGIGVLQIDSSSALGTKGRELHNCCGSTNARLRGTQPSAVLCAKEALW